MIFKLIEFLLVVSIGHELIANVSGDSCEHFPRIGMILLSILNLNEIICEFQLQAIARK